MHVNPRGELRASESTLLGEEFDASSGFAPRGVVLVLLICIATAAVWVSTPELYGRDSSAFLWVGDGILKGELPYAERWDHKGPLIYVLSAIAILIGGVGHAGVFILRAATLTITLLFLTASLGRRGSVPMVAAVAVLVIAPYIVVVEGGHLTEEYYLALASCGLYILRRGVSGRSRAYRFPLVGSLVACGFLLRPNLIGFGVAVVVCAVLSTGPKWAEKLRDIMGFVGGFAAVVVSSAAVLWLLGILDDCIEAVFVYNVMYSRAVEGPGVVSRLSMVFGSSPDRLLLTVASGAAAVAAIVAVDRRHDFARLIAVLWCVEIGLLAISGRPYRHYLLPLLVPFGYSIGLLAVDLRARWVAVARHRSLLAGTVLAITLLWSGVYFRIWRMDRFSTGHEIVVRQAIQEVTHHSHPGDAIVIWGAETVVLLETDRETLAPFFYSYPLLDGGDTVQEKRAEWFRDFEACTAVLIIDTSGTNSAVPRLSPRTADDGSRLRAVNVDRTVERVERVLARCYSPVQGEPPWPWEVYRLSQDDP